MDIWRQRNRMLLSQLRSTQLARSVRAIHEQVGTWNVYVPVLLINDYRLVLLDISNAAAA